MHFKTIKRDEILPMIEQTKAKKEQKAILCDLLDCTAKELEAIIRELKAERKKKDAAESENDGAVKAAAKKVAESDELTEIAAYAKKLEGDLNAKEKELAEVRKAAAEVEVSLGEELEAAWREAEQRAKEAAVLKERTQDYLTQMLKSDKKVEILSIALSKSLEFIASLNAVIAEVLKA